MRAWVAASGSEAAIVRLAIPVDVKAVTGKDMIDTENAEELLQTDLEL